MREQVWGHFRQCNWINSIDGNGNEYWRENGALLAKGDGSKANADEIDAKKKKIMQNDRNKWHRLDQRGKSVFFVKKRMEGDTSKIKTIPKFIYIYVVFFYVLGRPLRLLYWAHKV
jgi:hypothetical protein